MPDRKSVLLIDTITFETIDLKFEMMYFSYLGLGLEMDRSGPFQYFNAIL